jgi:LPPG:FO 2-phospho-L-lactate transferase
MRIVALAGGVGGAKLALGFSRVMDARDLTIIANTGDDIAMHGLHVSPDPDILIYTLAGLVNPETGWGFAGETFTTQHGLARYGREVWFNLGDRDLATHIHRTAILKEGKTLSDAIGSIAAAHGVTARILPMSDDPVPTMLDTDEGRMHLQDYFVRRKCQPVITGIAFQGAAHARPAPGVIDAIADADGIVICPSNPLISIGPILAVPGIRDALRKRRGHVAAVSPIVGGRSLKGPSDKMMRQMGHAASALGVARLYADIAATMIVDIADANSRTEIEELSLRAVVVPTVMGTLDDKERLARAVIGELGHRLTRC